MLTRRGYRTPHSDRVSIRLVQVVVGALVMATGVALAVAGSLGWRGSLPRNRFVGVRTVAAMASDDAFRAGNRVAGPVLVAAGLVAVLGGLAALAAPSAAAFAVVAAVAAAGALGLALAGGVLGSRAAASTRSVGARPVAARPVRARPERAACAGCACGGPGSAACVQ